MSAATFYLLLPEIILVLIATAIYVGGAFTHAREGWNWLATAGVLLAALALWQQTHPPAGTEVAAASNDAVAATLSGPIVIDAFTQALRWGILGAGLVFIFIASRQAAQSMAPEFMGSLLLILAGLMLISESSDLVLMFLGLELVSIPTYVILYLGRGDAASQEAATKYFFLSILSSGLLLYGLSFLYGVGGTTQLVLIREHLADLDKQSGMMSLARLAMVFIFAGLGFRLTAVPFHFYAPDVYQGTSNPNAGLLAVAPKIAGLAALVRIASVSMPGLEQLGWYLSLSMAVVTMTLGNLLALWQQNIRRLLAYSSIAHAGYMLIGLAVAFAVAGGATGPKNLDGIGATLFYLLVYALATAGSFAVLTYLGSEDRQIDGVDELAGVGRTHPIAGLCLAICMFSLTGLPPLAGFWGKFALFLGAVGVDADKSTAQGSLWLWFVGLAIVGVVNAAISAAYYLRIVATMYFRNSLTVPSAAGGLGAGIAMVVCAALVVVTGGTAGTLLERTNAASAAARTSFIVQKSSPAATKKPVAAALDHGEAPQVAGAIAP